VLVRGAPVRSEVATHAVMPPTSTTAANAPATSSRRAPGRGSGAEADSGVSEEGVDGNGGEEEREVGV
jgi:hypothetical protein